MLREAFPGGIPGDGAGDGGLVDLTEEEEEVKEEKQDVKKEEEE